MISENNFSINFKLNVIKKLWYYCLGFLIYVITMYQQDMQQVKKKCVLQNCAQIIMRFLLQKVPVEKKNNTTFRSFRICLIYDRFQMKP